MKTCSKCKIEKDLDLFPNSKAHGGKYPQCKACKYAQGKKDYKKRQSHYKNLAQARYEGNKEAHQAQTTAWRVNNPEKHAAISKRSIQKRRAQKLNAVCETIDIAILYARDLGICQLCGEICAESEASIDHIIPLSKQGNHTYANTHLAHISCNSRKHNKLPDELPQELSWWLEQE